MLKELSPQSDYQITFVDLFKDRGRHASESMNGEQIA